MDSAGDSKDLSFSYGAVRALDAVSMSMAPGEITCVMGRNGVGKTTLMKNIVGVLRSSRGKIELAGQDVTPLPPHKRVKSGIAHVPQGRQIFPKLDGAGEFGGGVGVQAG